MILFINACVRRESRTAELAECLLEKLGEDFQELKLSEIGLQPLSEERLEKRTRLIEEGDYSDPMFDLAKQFAAAEKIVIASPYWDLSFSSLIKLYVENIYVSGIVSKYDENGMPVGLCKAEKLYYVTTAGGPYVSDYSYGYISDVAVNFFGVKKTCLIKAEMLDIVGNDPEEILEKAKNSIIL